MLPPLTLDPDAAEEAARNLLDGGDVEDLGGNGAEEVVAQEGEVVVLAIEAGAVDDDHAHEAGLVIGEVQIVRDAGDVAEGVLEAALLGCSPPLRKPLSPMTLPKSTRAR